MMSSFQFTANATIFKLHFYVEARGYLFYNVAVVFKTRDSKLFE